MYDRTFGWVQNPSDFIKLKRTVQIFESNSSHYKNLKDIKIHEQIVYFDNIRDNLQNKLDNNIINFSYIDLVGSSKDKHGNAPRNRSAAEADSLIQISLVPQQWKRTGKMFSDNWTSDGFLRWAVTLNFTQHDRNSDMFTITDLGKEFAFTEDDSNEEQELLINSLLKYPPATQVLRILSENDGYKTKFFIGNQLGFRGEKGFTSYDETLMIDWIKSAPEHEITSIRNDVEGTSDKYARMISTWLKKLGLIYSHSEKIEKNSGKFNNFMAYEITAKGKHSLRQANGFSSNSRVRKHVMWEFLATNGSNRNYVRTRRAHILKSLQETSSFNVLLDKLKQSGFDDDKYIINNDIRGLSTFGLRIIQDGNTIELKDLISDFTIPDLHINNILKDEASEKRKADYMRNTNLEPKYIELLEIAYDGNRNRDFEIITAELFRKIYGLNSMILGGARKPDCLVFTNKFGIIVDTKAYSNGYSRSISQADQMIRYIEDNKRRDSVRNPTEWWTEFDPKIHQNQFYFLWVSSKFIGTFEEQLDYTARETNTFGGALSVEQLLTGADAVLKGTLDPNNLPNYMNNSEIIF